VQLGTKTLDAVLIAAHVTRAARTPSRMLRVVLEEEGTSPPPPAQLASLLAAVWPCLSEAGVRLAIENHFDIPSSRLAEAVRPYPPGQVGFCVDTANSLRNFESPEAVLELLGPRAYCYHVKDFTVAGHLLGFTVGGAPLGKGKLDLDGVLDRILARDPEPSLFVENWVPPGGNRDTDIAEDARWLAEGADELRRRLRDRGVNT
jgi:sugar phosphate isomerase/epimerase